MPLPADRLSAQLARGLAPVYLIAGDEPLLVDEAVAAVRAAATAAGYGEREVHSVEAGFDWDHLTAAAQSLSLFSSRRLIEIRLPTGKPGDGAAVLAALCARPDPDTIVLVSCGKLEKAQRESAWARAFEGAGVFVYVWAIDPAALPAWIERRLVARGLRPEAGVVESLAYHMEGNLLACAQEIDKLALLPGPGPLRLADLEESMADQARFSVFGLVDTCLRGEAAAATRMLASLRAEGLEPILALWALTRELRALAEAAFRIEHGDPEGVALSKVWNNRRPLVRAALRRFRARQWQALLARCARIDRMIKGRAVGAPWFELERLVLVLCGIRGLPAAAEAG